MTSAAVAIFLAAASVRLWHVWQMRSTPYFSVLMGDSRGYDAWAREIAAGAWIGRDVFYQAPLYPYFIGLVYAIFGEHLLALRLVQALVGSLSCVLVGYAGTRWFSRRVGLMAGLGLAFYAPAIFFDGIVQKSVLDVFFVCAALAALGYLAEGARSDPPSVVWAWIALGIVIGCLGLTRENALLLIGVVGLWVVWRAVKARPTSHDECAPRRAPLYAAPLLFLLGVGATLLPVAIRNYAVDGGVYLTTSQFGPNFYIGNNPDADGTYRSLSFGRGVPEFERVDATELAERALGRTLTPAEVSSYWTDRALAFVTSEPARWLRLQARKVALLVNATEMADTESQEAHAEYSWPLRVLTPFAHFGILVPLAVFGVCLTWWDRRRLWILYAIGLTFAASTVMFYVLARYRHPLVPLLLLFAAAGLTAVFSPVKDRHEDDEDQEGRSGQTGSSLRGLRGNPWVIGAVLVAAVASNWPMLSVDRMRAITETNLGAAFFLQRRFSEAEARYRKALAIQADYSPAYNNLGMVLRAQGHLDEAIRTYQQGLQLGGDHPDLHFNLANALIDDDRPSEAAEHFRKAATGMPDSPSVHNNLGMVLAAKGQYAEAAKEFQIALTLDPDFLRAHRSLGSVLRSIGRADEALVHLRRAVEIAPSDAEARYDLGSFWLDRGHFREAVDELRAAVAAKPDYVEARNNLAIALASQGELREAMEQWEAALKIKPDFVDAQRNLEMARKQLR